MGGGREEGARAPRAPGDSMATQACWGLPPVRGLSQGGLAHPLHIRMQSLAIPSRIGSPKGHQKEGPVICPFVGTTMWPQRDGLPERSTPHNPLPSFPLLRSNAASAARGFGRESRRGVRRTLPVSPPPDTTYEQGWSSPPRAFSSETTRPVDRALRLPGSGRTPR